MLTRAVMVVQFKVMEKLGKIGLAFAAAGFLISSCFAAKQSMSMKLPPVMVNTALVKEKTYQQKISVTGTLEAWQGIVVRPEIAGHITKIFFKSGETVKENTPLVLINPDIDKAQLYQATAKYNLTKLSYERAKKLYKTHAVSTADLDQAAENMKVAEGAMNEWKARVAQTLIRAPFPGRLGLRQISLGDYVSAGQSVVNLQQLNPLRVEFSVPETYIAKLSIGQNVDIHVASYPKEIFKGKIYAIESLLNVNTRSLNVRAKLDNPKNRLLPGTFAETSVYIGQKEKALSIPQVAVMYDETGPYVYKLITNKAVKTRIKIGYRDTKYVIVTKGLKVKDVVVTAGQLKLRSGSPVIVR